MAQETISPGKTYIKRLYLEGKEFVPITLAEAVVVNTEGIPGLKPLLITTLDKVLARTLGIIGTNAVNINTLNAAVETINTALSNKLDKLIPGEGIEISGNTIKVTTVPQLKLYKIVNSLPQPPSKEYENFIYLKLTDGGVEGNYFTEYICVQNLRTQVYGWELIGVINTDVDLSGYITSTTFNEKIGEINTSISSINETLKTTITAENVTTSDGLKLVCASYEIPKTLYDDLMNPTV